MPNARATAGAANERPLVRAAPGGEGPRLAALAEGLGFRLAEIGELQAEGEVILEGGWPKALFSHFEGQS